MKTRPSIILIGVLLGILFSAGCATTGRPSAGSLTQGEAFLKDLCEAQNVPWQWDHVVQVVILKHRGVTARVLVGSEIVIIDGERVLLSAPVRTVRSAIIVPPDFQSKVLDHLKAKGGSAKAGFGAVKGRPVIIDAGHGGKDPGTIGVSGTHEKDIVLDIASRLAKSLEGRGVKIIMTRDKDEFISLEERTQIASSSDARLFVSIHANSSPSKSVSGLEVYGAKAWNFDERTEPQRMMNQDLFFKNYSMDRSDKPVRDIVQDLLYEDKQAKSRKLAEQVVKRLVQDLKMKNLGVKEARFFVLRNTLVPAILVEVGFLSNAKEEKLLKNADYRERVARSLAENIAQYFKTEEP